MASRPVLAERDDRGASASWRFTASASPWSSPAPQPGDQPGQHPRPAMLTRASPRCVTGTGVLPAHRDTARTRRTRRPDQYRRQHLVSAQRHPSARVPGIPLRVADQVLAAIARAGNPQRPRAHTARHTCHEDGPAGAVWRGLGRVRGVEAISITPCPFGWRWRAPGAGGYLRGPAGRQPGAGAQGETVGMEYANVKHGKP